MSHFLVPLPLISIAVSTASITDSVLTGATFVIIAAASIMTVAILHER